MLKEILFANALLGESGGGGGGGSSDLDIATLTVTNGSTYNSYLAMQCVYTDDEFGALNFTPINIPQNSTKSVGVVLYKGKAFLLVEAQSITSLSGNIAFDDETGMYAITGDCSLVGEGYPWD